MERTPKIRVNPRYPRKSAIQTKDSRGAADPQENKGRHKAYPYRKENNRKMPKMLTRKTPQNPR